MIFFNPGPSKVYDEVGQYLQDAFQQGILSINHRSSEFTSFSKKAINLLHEKLNIPADYTILFTSSATESWEIIPQSLTGHQSVHFYNGDFGKKWFEYAGKIHPASVGVQYSVQEKPDMRVLEAYEDADILSLTLNETSTGTQVRSEWLAGYKSYFPHALLALDATSCLGGIQIDYTVADVIYGSVQKCLGLPAGLGLLICSPKAVQRAKEIGDKKHYNSLLGMLDKIKDYQTNYTPNVLGIYLLSRVLEKMEPISVVSARLKKQAADWNDFIPEINGLSLFIENAEVRSDTVVTVSASVQDVERFKKEARKKDIVLGGGYGDIKTTTFRIANFPAIRPDEIAALKEFLASTGTS